MRCWWSWAALCLLLVALPSASADTSSSSSLLSAFDEIPKCALKCITTTIANSGCSLLDPGCLCKNATIQADASDCVVQSCHTLDVLKTQNVTETACGFPVRNRSKPYQILSIALLIVSGLCVIQRFIFKSSAKVGLGVDDWLILLTLVLVIGSTVVNMGFALPNGVGRDIWTLTSDQIVMFMKTFQILGVLYFAEIAMMKLSLLFFLLRIFPTDWVRYLLWGTIFFNGACGLSYVLVGVFECRPINYFYWQWDDQHHGTCSNLNIVAISHAAISIFLDLWMLIIPLSQLASLNLDWKKRIGVALMFCVGTGVTVISILRLRSVIKFGKNNQNPTWMYIDVAIWSITEIHVGIICACMPAIRLLFVRVSPKKMWSTPTPKPSATESSGGTSDSKSWGSRQSGATSELWGLINNNNSRKTVPRLDVEAAQPVEYELGFPESDETILMPMREMKALSAKSRWSQ